MNRRKRKLLFEIGTMFTCWDSSDNLNLTPAEIDHFREEAFALLDRTLEFLEEE